MPVTKRKRKSKVPELKVVFDTSVLYTGSEGDLLCREAKDIIREHSRHRDIAISWYLPDVVRHERQFQMQKLAMELLPYIEKLERLLGHNLNITETILMQSVKSTVETQLTDMDLNILQLDPSKVDWDKLKYNSCYRHPPFQDGQNEKGFRDALIAETFIQLVEASPVTPKVCRVVLVTGDRLLRDAVTARCEGATNVRILVSLEEVKGLVNTLVAEIGEDVVAAYQEKAKKYFFEPNQEKSLYHKLSIGKTILDKFWDVLQAIPQGASERKNGTWYIHPPSFVRKRGQRVFWSTRIVLEAEAYRWAISIQPPGGYGYSGQVSLPGLDRSTLTPDLFTPTPGSTPSLESGLAWSGSIPAPVSDFSKWLASGSGSIPSIGSTIQTKELFSKGKSVFEVVWSISITATEKLTFPKIISINHVRTTWEQAG